jgi:hypothetical protein
MELAEYKRLYGGRDDSAPGWDAIDGALKQVYGDQEPKHWGTAIKHMLGGPDPIDGISAYQCRDGGIDHLHFCTYGFSSLYYDEETAGGDFSGYGFELTFRLASPLPPPEEPNWALNLIQNIARYVFKSNRCFEPYQYIPAGGPIRGESDTDLVGLAFLADPILPPIDTPHGQVDFVQMFGITSEELESLKSKTRSCEDLIEQHRKTNPLLITDLSRRSGN